MYVSIRTVLWQGPRLKLCFIGAQTIQTISEAFHQNMKNDFGKALEMYWIPSSLHLTHELTHTRWTCASFEWARCV